MEEKHIHLLRKFSLLLLYGLAIAFSIKSLREPDLWWQIRTGEWILEHGKVPLQDVFSFTRDGVRWINIKWLSEVFVALLTKLSGPEAVMLLQALVSCLMVFFLLKWTALFTPKSSSFWISATLLLIVLLVGSEYRMTGRPEMYSHLFTVVFCYLYMRHLKTNDKWIWLIIPLQILWANLHEAFAIGIVVSSIFTIASFVDALLKKEPQKQTAVLLAVTILSIVCIIINPNGIDLLVRPLAIFGQLEANKYTTELFSISSYKYWTKEAWIGLFFLLPLIGFIGYTLWILKFKGVKTLMNKELITYVLLTLAFIYLAITAYRNIVFVLLILYPTLVFVLDKALHYLLLKQPKLETPLLMGTVVLLILMYSLVVSDKWYSATKSLDHFGMEVLSINNPKGAGDYLSKHNIKGKIFSDYLTSSYLLWKLQPDFKTYIDLRDLDVFSDTSFSEFAAMVQIPQVFEQQDSLQHFDAVVLFRPEFSTLHRYLYTSGKWHAAFADAVAVVYLRDTTTQNLQFSACQQSTTSTFCSTINKILYPLYKGFQLKSIDEHKIAATYFLNVLDFEQALKESNLSIASGIAPDESYTTLGDIYYNRSKSATTAEGKTQDLQLAFQAYQTAISKNEKNGLARLGIGAVYFQNGNFRAAAEQFEEGIQNNPNELNLHLFAANAYSQLMVVDKGANAMLLQHYKLADRLNPNNPLILLNIATAAYRAGDCKEAATYAKRISNIPDFNKEEQRAIQTILEKCRE